MFIEADDDVTLEELGDAPHPPFPCIDELIFKFPAPEGCLTAHCYFFR